jgi:hypothetical protein
MARISATELSESLTTLREWIPRDSVVFTILRSVSRSGMRREIGVVVFPPGSKRPVHPNYSVSLVLGLRQGKRDGVIVNGCGMDMGFEIVYRLGSKLYDEGYALKHEWL